MNSKLFIASKVKVGFNLRDDTYTGKLGYVIGFDGKKWRKEPSWDSWRLHYKDGPEMEQKKLDAYNYDLERHTSHFNKMVDEITKNPSRYLDHWYRTETEKGLEGYLKKHRIDSYERYQPNLGRLSSNKEIIPLEFENVPTEGFVLNKKAGGYSSGWNHRSTYCRVYDPRGFEFEISIPNLLYILQECNSMKGKGLEGEFVYAWDGKDLVLLPTSSEDYITSDAFTKAQQGKVSVKELEVGLTYKHKSMEDYVYLGRFNYFDNIRDYKKDIDGVSCKKAHVFYNITRPSKDNFISLTALAPLIGKVTDTQIDNFSEIFDKFTKSRHSDNLRLVKMDDYNVKQSFTSYGFNGLTEDCFIKLDDNKYEVYSVSVDFDRVGYYHPRQYRAKNYSLKGRFILTIDENGDFSTKVLKKNYENISIQTFEGLNPKTLNIKINNEIKKLVF